MQFDTFLMKIVKKCHHVQVFFFFLNCRMQTLKVTEKKTQTLKSKCSPIITIIITII